VTPQARVVALAATLAGATVGAGPVAAHAEPAPRTVHGSAGAGHSLLLTGAGGDHNRFELAASVKPWSRYGAHVAWRAFDTQHRGLVLGGLLYEAGAARPRLVLDLHLDVGADLDRRAPVVGGGVRTTLGLWGPLGLGLDAGGYLVIDGLADTRLVIATSSSLVVRW
jgi:hypothetical protein